jgi:hypothetical protein
MPALKIQLRAFTSKVDKMMICLLFASSLLTYSSAFSTTSLLPTRTPVSIAPVVGPARLPFSYHQKRQNRRHTTGPRNALTYPIGGPGLLHNRSWEDLINQVPSQTLNHDEITLGDKVAIVGTAAFIASALFALISVSAPGSWRYFMAGGICAATSHSIPTPVDVVKVSEH